MTARTTFPIPTEYLTADEIAAILKVSNKTVIRRFESRPGVIDIGSAEGRFKRRYRVLRVPREVFEKFIAENKI